MFKLIGVVVVVSSKINDVLKNMFLRFQFSTTTTKCATTVSGRVPLHLSAKLSFFLSLIESSDENDYAMNSLLGTWNLCFREG